MAETKKTPKSLVDTIRLKLLDINAPIAENALAVEMNEDPKLVRKALLLCWEEGHVVRTLEPEYDQRANKRYDRWARPEVLTDGITYAMYVKALNDEEITKMAAAIGSRLSIICAAEYREKFKGQDDVLAKLKTRPQEWVAAVRRAIDDAVVKGDIELK